MQNQFKYWLFESYRRKKLDEDLFNASKYLTGKVLDVGAGRERGVFKNLNKQNWTIVDIDPALMPDIVAPVEALPFKDKLFHAIKATDVFGYVENPQKGFSECFRVLKKGGFLVLSVPYMTPFDNEQHDSQRFTEYKLKNILETTGFNVIKFKSQGYFFTVWADMCRDWIRHSWLPIRFILYFTLFPALDVLVWYESKIKLDKFWTRYATGFFIIAKK